MLGLDELSAADQLTVRRARRLEHFLTQPFFVTEMFTGHRAGASRCEQTVAGCEAILEGKFDDRDEGALYMIGAIEEAKREPGAGIIAPDRVLVAGPRRRAPGGGCQRAVRDLARPRGLLDGARPLRATLSTRAGGRESFAAVDGGVLLLEGGRISVVTRDAVVAERLEDVADEAAAMLAPARTGSKRLAPVSPSSRRR